MVQRILCSTVTQKFVMAVTGIALVLFVIVHLSGNIPLYFPDGTPFNQYADFLASLGWLLYVAEVGLLLTFILHVATGIRIRIANKKARPVGYKVYQTKGGPSKANIASRFMPITGLGILLFLIFHIWQFKLGPGISEGYVQMINGQEVRDLHRLVIETFQNPLFVAIYVACMVVLGIHLRHGIWSAFQSLGLRNQYVHNILYKLALVLSILIALGFLGIPLWIYLNSTGVVS